MVWYIDMRKVGIRIRETEKYREINIMAEDGLKTISVLIDGMHCDSCIKTIKNSLEAVDGVAFADVAVGKADISYLPQLVSPRYLETVIQESGYSVRKKVKKKGPFGRYIDRMIESNEKNFGTQKLDCCSLSKEDRTSKSFQKGRA